MKLTFLKTLVDQVAKSKDFQNKDIICKIYDSPYSECLLVSNSNPPNYDDCEVQIDLTNTKLIIREDIKL